jgi:hypothetical protein
METATSSVVTGVCSRGNSGADERPVAGINTQHTPRANIHGGTRMTELYREPRDHQQGTAREACAHHLTILNERDTCYRRQMLPRPRPRLAVSCPQLSDSLVEQLEEETAADRACPTPSPLGLNEACAHPAHAPAITSQRSTRRARRSGARPGSRSCPWTYSGGSRRCARARTKRGAQEGEVGRVFSPRTRPLLFNLGTARVCVAGEARARAREPGGTRKRMRELCSRTVARSAEGIARCP